MLRHFRILATALLASAAACSQAYSDGRGGASPQVLVAADPGASAPYGVEIVDDRGATMQTYHHNGRYYVLGDAGARYLIRVNNPTDRRVEAVVTVDGLDVIDGEPGDLRKRGYVVPARGELRIEGWRTSTAQVATFRFSSVGASYAGRKGKARNVGVIAVALFEEVAPAELILDQPTAPPPVTYYDEKSSRTYDADLGGDVEAEAPSRGGGTGRVGAADRAPSTSGGAVMRPPPPPRDDQPDAKRECCDKGKHRPGLGTEYGEQRYSAATWTRFVRASDTPTAVAELRYNDAAGLTALGIPLAAPVDPEEVTRRETADPFPGDHDFARPPAGIR
jgi:hypothetical protein